MPKRSCDSIHNDGWCPFVRGAGIKSFFTDLFSGLDFSSLDCLNPEEESPFLHLQYSNTWML